MLRLRENNLLVFISKKLRSLKSERSQSGISFFLWRVFRRKKHPKRYRGFLGLLFDVPIIVLVSIFISLHIVLGLITIPLYDVVFMGQEAFKPGNDSVFNHIYYALINQISPGFTEFLPTTQFGRFIATLQAFTGLVINAFFLSTIVSRSVHPRGTFEVSPFMLHSPTKNKFIFRLYSKYPEPVFNIEFKLFRFLMHEASSGQVLGRSEEIDIVPRKRSYVRPFYALLIDVDIIEDRNWYSLIESGTALRGIPRNWFFHDPTMRGHYYLIISAETSSGSARQVVDFFFNDRNMACGNHAYMNDDLSLNMTEWYDYRKYRWDTWNQVRPDDCSLCTITRCLMRKNEMVKVKIQIDEIEFDGEITDNSFISLLPIVGVTRRHGDECYFVVNYEISYTGTQTEFQVGDIVYWKSNKNWKQAVALFFGNTPELSGDKPRTPSEAIKIGSFSFKEDAKKILKTGDIGRIIRM